MAPKQKQTNMMEDFLISGVAAITSKTVSAPIERVKLLLQNQSENAAITKPYTGIMDCVRRVPQEQGMGSFWRGNLANCVRYFPTQALNFAFKDFYKTKLGVSRDQGFWPCLMGNVASGGAAGATSLLVVYPLDFARTRLAVDVGQGANREFTGMVDCITKTARRSGLFGTQGVYKGFVVSCVGIIVYRGFYFGMYDTVKQTDAMQRSGFWGRFALGYAVTVASGLCSYPIDTIRRRMQMTSGSEVVKYRNSMHCATLLLKDEGFAAMYKGAGSNILRGMCGALVLVGFDYAKDMYIKVRDEHGMKREKVVV